MNHLDAFVDQKHLSGEEVWAIGDHLRSISRTLIKAEERDYATELREQEERMICAGLTRVEAKITKMDEKLEEMITKTDEKLEEMITRMDEKFDKIEGKIDDFYTIITKCLEAMPLALAHRERRVD